MMTYIKSMGTNQKLWDYFRIKTRAKKFTHSTHHGSSERNRKLLQETYNNYPELVSLI